MSICFNCKHWCKSTYNGKELTAYKHQHHKCKKLSNSLKYEVINGEFNEPALVTCSCLPENKAVITLGTFGCIEFEGK